MDNWLERAITKFDEDEKQWGDMLTRDWLMWALDIKEPATIPEFKDSQLIFLERFMVLKDYLLIDRKCALDCIRSKGYMIVHPKDQARLAADNWASDISKAHKKADKILTHTKTDELTNDEKKRHTDVQIRIAGVGQMTKNARVDVFKKFALE